jgi:hypothetical protein
LLDDPQYAQAINPGKRGSPCCEPRSPLRWHVSPCCGRISPARNSISPRRGCSSPLMEWFPPCRMAIRPRRIASRSGWEASHL